MRVETHGLAGAKFNAGQNWYFAAGLNRYFVACQNWYLLLVKIGISLHVPELVGNPFLTASSQ